ncbi:MAG: AbrB/MazE/SpoVT family DNA-binding domain-containing protein [Methanomicrobia archaeon]|nr:AbrB/MazE/SpoVT family DNA-binding domain-containing protein [Methanomicrobia archaeon]
MSGAMVSLDKQNRVALPKDVIDKLGLTGKVVLVDLGDHIGIYPVPKDPYERLHGSFTTEKPFKELRRRAEELALDDAGR